MTIFTGLKKNEHLHLIKDFLNFRIDGEELDRAEIPFGKTEKQLSEVVKSLLPQILKYV